MAAAEDALVFQFTDLHLFADADRVNEGLLPARSLRAVMAAARAAHGDPAAVLLTGDYTNDDLLPDEGAAPSYRHVVRLVRDVFPQHVPVLYVPGNHEDLPLMERLFSEAGWLGPAGGAPLAAVDVGAWRVLLASTYIKGAVHGQLSAATVEALGAELAAAAASGRPCLLALHHPPVEPAGDAPPWAGHCLRDAGPLLALLEAHASARVVVHGHLHADVHKRAGHADVYCTPSTCHQTVVASPTWEVDTASASGYRVLRLRADGTHDTAACRVQLPDDCLAPRPPEQ